MDEADKLMSELVNKNKFDAWLAEFSGDIDMSAGRPFGERLSSRVICVSGHLPVSGS